MIWIMQLKQWYQATITHNSLHEARFEEPQEENAPNYSGWRLFRVPLIEGLPAASFYSVELTALEGIKPPANESLITAALCIEHKERRTQFSNNFVNLRLSFCTQTNNYARRKEVDIERRVEIFITWLMARRNAHSQYAIFLTYKE